MTSRRRFLSTAALAAPAVCAPLAGCAPGALATPPRPTERRGGADRNPAGRPSAEALRLAAEAPVIRRDRLPAEPVTIESVDLLRNGEHWTVRVRAAGGVEGVAVGNGYVLQEAFLILLRRVAPRVVGTDARDWEATLESVYLSNSSYKWQGLPFWVSVASVEMAVLDLLGKAAGRPLPDLLWDGQVRDSVAIYQASSNRWNAPEEEVAWFEEQVEDLGAEAIKFRLGGRMMFNAESQARDRALVPLMRRAFPDLTLYADANGSFDVATAVAVGRQMADLGYAFFEEPVPFDHYAETRAVADALDLRVAGGEQESSARQFLQMIEDGTLDVVQPDLLYYGGLVRSLRVARAARAAGLDCTAHISGYGTGFLYAVHFAAVVPNAGPYQEYKGFDAAIPVAGVGSTLRPEGGAITVPTGPGLGIEIDSAWLSASEVVGASA